MEKFVTIKPENLDNNPFTLIGKDWLLISAEREGKVNTMTASWGGLGVIWNKNVAYIFIRDSRFTKEFVDFAESFSLSFFDHAKYASTLAYLGATSGRDEDKIQKAGLTTAFEKGVPYFSEAKTVLICRKLYNIRLTADGFVDGKLDEKFYADKDYHTLYVGEIEKLMQK